jgi:nucleoside 2-deoxyribosyltransferase
MWEVGYGYALGKPIVMYSTVPGRGLNLMLAQSVVGFVSGLDDVRTFLRHEAMPGFDWSMVQDWKGEVE